MTIDDKLKKLGISLPEPVNAIANYVPFVVTGTLVSISGQIPMGPEGLAYKGVVGKTVTQSEAVQAARLCAINIIAQLKKACNGDLGKVKRIIKLGGFVSCEQDFENHPQIINGASDLMVDVFGEIGRHSRSAVGVSSLPLGVPVEIDALVEIG